LPLFIPLFAMGVVVILLRNKLKLWCFVSNSNYFCSELSMWNTMIFPLLFSSRWSLWNESLLQLYQETRCFERQYTIRVSIDKSRWQE
jgi:hypothetical protein